MSVEGAGEFREGVTFRARVRVQEEEDVAGRGLGSLAGGGPETPVCVVDEDLCVRPERLDPAAIAQSAAVVHDGKRDPRASAGRAFPRVRERGDGRDQGLFLGPRNEDRRNFANQGLRARPSGPVGEKRLLLPRAPGENRQARPDEDRKKRSPPAELLDVGEVGAQQRQEAPHEKARLEVAEEGTPAVAGGPERAASGGPPAGARSLGAAERGRPAPRAPPPAGHTERKVPGLG